MTLDFSGPGVWTDTILNYIGSPMANNATYILEPDAFATGGFQNSPKVNENTYVLHHFMGSWKSTGKHWSEVWKPHVKVAFLCGVRMTGDYLASCDDCIYAQHSCRITCVCTKANYERVSANLKISNTCSEVYNIDGQLHCSPIGKMY